MRRARREETAGPWLNAVSTTTIGSHIIRKDNVVVAEHAGRVLRCLLLELFSGGTPQPHNSIKMNTVLVRVENR